MTTRYIVDYDDDARFEECNGEYLPLTYTEYRENEYMKDGKPVSYSDYLNYYGNPARHVYVFIRREDRCEHCGKWSAGGALYGIDFMDDDIEASYIGTYTLDDLPKYLRECAQDLESAKDMEN